LRCSALSRRHVLVGAQAGLAAALTQGLPGSARAGAPLNLTICGTWELTAPGIANSAALADRGCRVAVETLSPVLDVNGSYVSLDSEGDPGKGVRKVAARMSQGTDRFFVGGASSAVALAVSKEVSKTGGVYVTTGGADELTGSDCAKSTFRWPAATYGAVEGTVRPLRQMLPDAKRWFTITPKYVFGDALLRNTKRVLADTGAEHVGNAYHGLSEREFSGTLTDALAAGPDVLCVHSFSGQATDLLRQAGEFGLKNRMRIVIVWAAGLDQFHAIGPELMDGVFVGAQYWHTVDTPGNSAIVAAFRRRFNAVPSLAEATGYMLARLIMEGAAKAQSTDPQKVIAALEGYRYEGPTGPEEVRAADHQCLKAYYLARGKPPGQMRDADDFLDIVATTRAAIDPSLSGCTAI
jgi:branched-chain amino acid transport system substrate-binding protein